MTSSVLCLTLLFGAAPASGFQSSIAPVDGAVAPADTWYTRGGCASRSGMAATLPLEGELGRAWSFEARATIDCEPLVWNQDVFVSSHDEETGRGYIEWIDLESGRLIDRENIKTEWPLEPSIWRNRLVLRSGRKKISFYKLSKGAMTRINDYRAKAEVSAPLLFENQAFLFEGGVFVALKSGRRTVDWRCSSGFIGAPSLYADDVYGLHYEQGGTLEMVQLDRESGEERQRQRAGYYGSGIRRFKRQPFIQVFRPLSFVHYPWPVASADGQNFESGYLRGRSARVALIESLAPVTLADGLVLGFFGGKKPGLQHLELDMKGSRGRLLAQPSARPELFENVVAPTLVGGRTAYLSRLAFDVEDQHVLWKREGEARFPLVPARDTVLVVDGVNRLSALRHPDLKRTEPILLGSASQRRRAEASLLVRRSGEVSEGVYEVDWKARTLSEGEEQVSFQDVLLLCDEDERPLVATSGAGLADAMSALGSYRAAPEYVRLASEGVTTRDPVLLGRLAAKARAAGAEDESLLNVEKRVEAWSKKPSKRIDREAVRALEKREREVDRRRATTAFELLEHLPAKASSTLVLQLLRLTLIHAPDHDGALEAVWTRVEQASGESEVTRRILEQDRAHPSAERALGWLDYLGVADAHPTSFFALPEKDTGLTPDELALGRATTSWRKDLVGIRSGELRLVTPLTDPGILAQCLATGHLVTSHLDGLFGASLVAGEGKPLTLYLYESKEEYQEQTARRGEGEESDTRYRAGHYSPRDNLQHVYMPSSRDARERVLRTYAHELTHNWAQVRCRLPELVPGTLKVATPWQRDPAQPGYWIVEGFAKFVEEFQYDFEAGRADPFNPRARSLDTVVNAPTRLRWGLLYRVSQELFHELSFEPRHRVALEWQLGRSSKLSDTNLFYDQAAATVHYLYHGDEGRYRSELVRYIIAYYNGDQVLLDIQASFGLSPKELGERVEAFAAEMLEQG